MSEQDAPNIERLIQSAIDQARYWEKHGTPAYRILARAWYAEARNLEAGKATFYDISALLAAHAETDEALKQARKSKGTRKR